MKGQISSVKGSLLPQFSYYTLAKIIPIFPDFQNRNFDFDIAALDMMNLEWSYIFPQSRINIPFVVSFILLRVIVETKVIRETSLKNHISGSRRGISISPWSQLNLGSIKRLWCVHMPGIAMDNGEEGRKRYITLGPCNRIFYCDFRLYRMSVRVAKKFSSGSYVFLT